MGSAIFVSIAIVHIRKRAFEKRFVALIEEQSRQKQIRKTLSFKKALSKLKSTTGTRTEEAVASGAVRGRPIKADPRDTDKDEDLELEDGHISTLPERKIAFGQPAEDSLMSHTTRCRHPTTNAVVDEMESNPNNHLTFIDMPHPARQDTSPLSLRPSRSRTRVFSGNGVGARNLNNHPRNASLAGYPTQALDSMKPESDPRHEENHYLFKMDKYLKTIDGYIGRNSQFHNLSEKERRKLGGIEYDAICLLSYVIPLYFVLWQLLGAVGVGAWIQINRPDLALTNGKILTSYCTSTC